MWRFGGKRAALRVVFCSLEVRVSADSDVSLCSSRVEPGVASSSMSSPENEKENDISKIKGVPGVQRARTQDEAKIRFDLADLDSFTS